MPLPEPLRHILTTTLFKIREESGLSQDKVAARGGISSRHYQAIEKGNRTPTFNTVFKISEALGVEYTDILDPVFDAWKQLPDDDRI